MTSVMTQMTAGIVLAMKSVTGINKQTRRALLGVLPTDTADKFGDCDIMRMHKPCWTRRRRRSTRRKRTRLTQRTRTRLDAARTDEDKAQAYEDKAQAYEDSSLRLGRGRRG